jgi:predicted RNA binding protein YcfA (HicA-like mRNA interferase family)
MPKLPQISGKEVVNVFEHLGFKQARQRGSLVVMRRDEKGCVIPLHRELAIGTLRSIIRQAGVSIDEFMEAYEEK